MLKVEPHQAGFTRRELSAALLGLGVGNELANFEPMVRYSFFAKRNWKTWTARNRHARLEANYTSDFPFAFDLFENTGLGLARNNFLGKDCVNSMILRWEKALSTIKQHSKKLRKAA